MVDEMRAPATSKPPNRRSRRQRQQASRRCRPATERALALLEALAATGRPASLKELALTEELPAATAFRLCRRLEEEGYVLREAGSRRYTPGARLLRLALDIVRASGPSGVRHAILAELVDSIGETCNLTAQVGHEVVYLNRVETKWPLRLALEPGSRVPIHCTASGKLFLSFMSPQMQERMLESLPLAAHAPNTIVEPRTLRRELQRIARRGYSTDDQEFLVGLVAVAVPVRDGRGQVLAAVATHAPVARLDLKRMIAEVPKLEAAAARIARTFE
jgi:DNA-binding IclR family transcriptional regulator